MEGDVQWPVLPVKMWPPRVTVAGNCSLWTPRAQAQEPVGSRGGGGGGAGPRQGGRQPLPGPAGGTHSESRFRKSGTVTVRPASGSFPSSQSLLPQKARGRPPGSRLPDDSIRSGFN